MLIIASSQTSQTSSCQEAQEKLEPEIQTSPGSLSCPGPRSSSLFPSLPHTGVDSMRQAAVKAEDFWG